MFKKLTILAVFTLSVVTSSLSPTLTTHAAPVTDFNPGYIIDDAVFYNKNAISVTDIQNFLNTLIPNCDINGTQPSGYGNLTNAQYAQQIQGWAGPPYVCINKYYENPDTGETSYEKGGGAFAGGQSAAQIIYNAAQTYNINPQVLLVMLKKESLGPLTADSWPLKNQYKYSMGYACPDSGPNYSANCNSNQAGFYKQMTTAAWQLNYYKEHPNDYRYFIGWNNIQYSTDPACGTKSVNIQNMATLSLYIYTPYTPNNASLNAYPGQGDGCSSYGNRNFFQYFKEWFGLTSYNGLIIQSNVPGSGLFLVQDGQKRPFPNEASFMSHGFKWSDVKTIRQEAFGAIPGGSPIPYNTHYRDGKLVNASGGIFIVENGFKRPFPNEDIYMSYGYTWSDAIIITSEEAASIPTGTILPYYTLNLEGKIVSSVNSGVYLVQNGQKRPFPDESAFLSQGFKWSDIKVLKQGLFSALLVGDLVPYNTHYRDGKLVNASGGIFIVENGFKRPFPNEDIYLSYGYKWTDAIPVTQSEISQLPYGTQLPYNVTRLEGMPVTSSGYGIFLIQGGQKRPFPNEASFISHGFKWSDVKTIKQIELDSIPQGPSI